MKEEKKTLEIEVILFIILLVIIAFGPAILTYLSTYTSAISPYTGPINQYYTPVSDALKTLMGWLVGISIPISVFFLVGIVYCVERLKHIRRKEAEIFDAKVEPAYEEGVKGDTGLSKRWDAVKEHVTSPNPSDWRQAILEADSMLDDALTSLGYRGDGIGEKLKRVVPGDMRSLDEAWEAHKIRNQIAHDGLQFNLTQHEANRVINLYKKVFEEFYYLQ